MRLVLILLLFIGLINADNKQKLTLGAGLYLQSQPYENVETIILPSPVIFYEYKIFYVRWTRFGVYFLGDKGEDFSWGFSLSAQPRPYGYKPKDSKQLAQMDERKTTFEGGLAFSTSYKKLWFEIMAVNDILNNTNTFNVKAEFGYDFEVGDFSFYPSFLAIFQDDGYMNYYYGVKQSEVIIGKRDFYKPKADLQLGLQTYIKYPLTKNISTLINIKIDKLPTQAINSPIVSEKYQSSGLISLIYTFEY